MSWLWVLTCEAYATPFLPHRNFCLLIVTSIQLWAVAVVMGPFPLQSGQQTATARQRNIQSTAEVTSTSNTICQVTSKQQRSPPHQIAYNLSSLKQTAEVTSTSNTIYCHKQTAEVTSTSNTIYQVTSKQQRSPPHQTQSVKSQAKT